jgi:signal transduction histidine kinase
VASAVPADLSELELHGRPRELRGMARREVVVEAGAGAAFLVAAVALAILGHHGRPFHWAVAAGLVVAFAAAVRARFDIGAGYVPPIQLAFVPMLFLVPPRLAPLMALAGWTAGRLPDLARGRMHASRLLILPGNCWFALGPAVVLTAFGIDAPSWRDWPIFVLALAAQFAGDLVSTLVRDRLVLGLTPEIELRSLGYVWLIDAALSPIGLLAAFASQSHRFAFLAVLPLAGLLVMFSHERTRRFEAERAGIRAREALLAGASHELQTPLAVLSGLIDTLARAPSLTLDRQAASYSAMQRQMAHLRHLTGQFVDYARLKAGQEIALNSRPTDVAALVAAVAAVWPDVARYEPAGEELPAVVDPSRLQNVVMSLISNAIKHGPPEGPVELRARREGRHVLIEVVDHGPGLPEDHLEDVFDELYPVADRVEGSGLGLFLARLTLRSQGGDVRLRNGTTGGLVATVSLPSSAP